jgi:putative hydrolase of the HAD superfamily
MSLKALYTDFGGVLVRTTDPVPRARLAESLGLSSHELERIIFESPSAQQAAVGAITQEQHWINVIRALGLPEGDIQRVSEEFFAGDTWDGELFDFLRGLRRKIKIGLISNAWSGLRRVILRERVDDAFDAMIISAEVKVAKPSAGIYRIALEKLGVTAEETAFVDDMPANLEAARSVGMQVIVFTQSQAVIEAVERLLSDHR